MTNAAVTQRSGSAVDGDRVNPCCRLGFAGADASADQRTRIGVMALRRGRGWSRSVVERDRQPRLFALLERLLTGEDDLDLELSDDEDLDALRAIGLLVSADELANDVEYQVPLDGAAPEPADGGDDGGDWIVHPGLALQSPPQLEAPAAASPTIWLADARSGVTAPYQPGALDAVVRACVPGQPPPPLAEPQRRQLRRAGLLVARADLAEAAAQRAEELAIAARSFAESGYAVVPGLLPRAQLLALQRYYRALIDEGNFDFGDSQVARRYRQHNEPIARLFLTALVDVVGAIAGAPIKPSYAYFASYREGAVLDNHRDRPQCEFSISFLVDYEPTADGRSPWPLWMRRQPDDVGVPLHQQIGDGIVYRGCELYHSRTALAAGHRSTHLFFHYVPRDFQGALD